MEFERSCCISNKAKFNHITNPQCFRNLWPAEIIPLVCFVKERKSRDNKQNWKINLFLSCQLFCLIILLLWCCRSIDEINLSAATISWCWIKSHLMMMTTSRGSQNSKPNEYIPVIYTTSYALACCHELYLAILCSCMSWLFRCLHVCTAIAVRLFVVLAFFGHYLNKQLLTNLLTYW